MLTKDDYVELLESVSEHSVWTCCITTKGVGFIKDISKNMDFFDEGNPIPRPTPTPRPRNYPIEFQDVAGYNDGNYAYVEGYAKNIGDASLGYVLIRVTFTDSKGNVLDIGNDYVGSISKLRPGDREHFSVTVKKPGKDWRYRVELESYR